MVTIVMYQSEFLQFQLKVLQILTIDQAKETIGSEGTLWNTLKTEGRTGELSLEDLKKESPKL